MAFFFIDVFIYFVIFHPQVVIEGVRGTGYVGDSAIDDVQLTKGEECLAALKRMMADTIVPGDLFLSPTNSNNLAFLLPHWA